MQKDVAREIGVSEATTYNWECNRTSLPVRFIPRIVQFPGYNTFSE
ncbi:MAG: hypothetical protein HY694_08070 [Deltaproteobacteria bacterium]|nr:hypothetical protein [Deltaproteobacteria bacterium]